MTYVGWYHIWHPALRALAMVSSPQSKVDDAAQDLVAADLGVVSVMQAGGWRTPRMVTRCSEHQTARRRAKVKIFLDPFDRCAGLVTVR